MSGVPSTMKGIRRPLRLRVLSDGRVGERVIAILPDSGGYAERCTAPAGLVARLPAAIPLDGGAAFQVQALTGYHMLHTLRATRAGETVLLHAASGGVGGAGLDFTPNGREPWLLVARAPGWAEVELHLEESGGGEVIAPGVEIEEAAIAVIA